MSPFPAALPSAALRDAYRRIDLPALHEPVSRAMTGGADRPLRHRLAGTFPAPTLEAVLANSMADLIDSDPEVRRVEDVAARLGVSVRTLQRLARRHVGLPPLAMIRRRRLQQAAEGLRTGQDTNLSEVAADLGYADHAHLANEFRSVLGFTLSAYRQRTSPTVPD